MCEIQAHLLYFRCTRFCKQCSLSSKPIAAQMHIRLLSLHAHSLLFAHTLADSATGDWCLCCSTHGPCLRCSMHVRSDDELAEVEEGRGHVLAREGP
jgi:hypothetical protein